MIFPDRGERYLDTIFCNEWVEEHFGSVLQDVDAGDELLLNELSFAGSVGDAATRHCEDRR